MRLGLRPVPGGPRDAARAALLVASAYALSGIVWLVLSDWALEALAHDQIAVAHTLRGLGFVAVTSVALYLALRSLLGALRGSAEARTTLAEEVRSRAEEQQRLAHRLFLAEEETRRAVAKDLHDGPLQALTISFMQLDAALRASEAAGAPLDVARVDGAMSTIKEASADIRAVLRALHPPLLAELGLSAAIERHCNEMAALTRRTVTFKGAQQTPTIPPATAIALFRIAQEAVANAVKHTADGTISVRIDSSPSAVRVEVTDTGPGFRPGKPGAGYGDGLGLISMRERAESVGAHFSLESQMDGTRVVVTAPLDA